MILCMHSLPRNRCSACRPARIQDLNAPAAAPTWSIKVAPPRGAISVAMVTVAFVCRGDTPGMARLKGALSFFEDTGADPEMCVRQLRDLLDRYEAAVKEAKAKQGEAGEAGGKSDDQAGPES